MAAPLKGIRVIDMTQVVVGPSATLIMADHGADVIKIENGRGDLARWIAGRAPTPGMSSKYLHLNRNKRSLYLDLKKPGGREALLRLAETADVFVYNVRPPAMARLKLTYDDLRAVNPKIIYCGLYGFGQDGRYAQKPAYDSIIQGSAGMAALHHLALGEPRYVPMVIADRTVGLMAVNFISMALFQREREGIGQSIDVPMFENMAAFVLSEHMYLKTFEPPLGPIADPRLIDPNARPLKTKDGWICITANTDDQVFGLFDAIGRPELRHDPRFKDALSRFDNIAEFFRIRGEAMLTKTTGEWVEILDRADVPAMPYHTLDSLMEDPHIRDVGLITTIEHPTEGRIRSLGWSTKLSTFQPSLYRHAPQLGEQSVEILGEIGYTREQIAAMIEAGTTKDGRPPALRERDGA